MASTSDFQVAALAAGFTLGFGFLTVWEAIKQTRRNRNPLRSGYIYMLWGEIIANVAIGIVGWLFLNGVLGPTLPVLFFILVFWVLEIQLLMQIIINRIAIIAETQEIVRMVKWGTFAIISAINLAVFIIWIPAHIVPPAHPAFVVANQYWDPTSKALILIVDAGLNWYFLRTVKVRLLAQHGLKKYEPLVGFNNKLMIVSILMDVMLIGLMFLPNPVVFIQFHPVAYMVKLNIEMSMASLIARLAKTQENSFGFNSLSYPNARNDATGNRDNIQNVHGENFTVVKAEGAPSDIELGAMDKPTGGIHRRFDVEIHTSAKSLDGGNSDDSYYRLEDEATLTSHAGPPKSG